MRRIFWLAAGLGAGATGAVLASRWARRQSERLAPANLGRRAGETVRGAGSLLTEAVGEYRRARAEREEELRTAMEEE